MGVPAWVSANYAKERPYLESLERYITNTLSPYCQLHKFPFHSRVKDESSVSEKLESGAYKSWDELDDLVAATIVVPNLTYEAQVIGHVSAVFSQQRVKSRHTSETHPGTFRFSSTRWYGKVRNDPAPSIPSRSLDIPFEVQVQTALEQAWLIATHDTTYKGHEVSWQQRRLAASVKASVEQLDLMIANFVSTAASIPQSPHSETDAKAYLVDVMRPLLEEGLLSPSLEPDSWSRFADNVWNMVERAPDTSATSLRLRLLVDMFATDVRRGRFSVAISGSLFQAILAFTHRRWPEMLDAGWVVPSVELTDLYELPTPRQPIAEPPSASLEGAGSAPPSETD